MWLLIQVKHLSLFANFQPSLKTPIEQCTLDTNAEKQLS